MKPSDPLTPAEIQQAADQFFPLLQIVRDHMPDDASTEDCLKVMEAVAKVAQKLRKEKADEDRSSFGFKKALNQ